MSSVFFVQTPEMARLETYNYSVTRPHLTPFVNLNEPRPFSDMQDTYGDLFEFRDHVKVWSFGVHKSKNFVFLRVRLGNF